jgi:hypothetical protein
MSATGEVAVLTELSSEQSSGPGTSLEELLGSLRRLSVFAKATTAELRLSRKLSTGSPTSEMSLEDSEKR